MRVRVFKNENARSEAKEISMLTNRTNRFETRGIRPATHMWLVGTPGVSSSVYCLGSIPAIFSIGGKTFQGQTEGLNSQQANSDSRQLQM
jgi:hypothetical protein